MKLDNCIVTKIATMMDGGLRITLDTQELDPEIMGMLMGLHKASVNVTFENPEFLPTDPQ